MWTPLSRTVVNGLDAESGPVRHGPKPNLHAFRGMGWLAFQLGVN